AEKAIGHVSYEPTEKQLKGRDFSRSLYVVKDVKKGEIISMDNVRSIRPGYGLHPKFLNDVLGKSYSEDIKQGTRMSLDLINFSYQNF
ncbi:SAF domain-containing protein, partial [Schleiferiaceae bacterium]|nr:SAF domain-containing protein [Schleiferiaceae bacterium]